MSQTGSGSANQTITKLRIPKGDQLLKVLVQFQIVQLDIEPLKSMCFSTNVIYHFQVVLVILLCTDENH